MGKSKENNKTVNEQMTVDNLRLAEKDGLTIESNYISCCFKARFDVDKRFGIEKRHASDYVNLFSDYYPLDERLEMFYEIQNAKGVVIDQIMVEDLLSSEKETILSLMKQDGLEECIAKMNEKPDTGINLQ